MYLCIGQFSYICIHQFIVATLGLLRVGPTRHPIFSNPDVIKTDFLCVLIWKLMHALKRGLGDKGWLRGSAAATFVTPVRNSKPLPFTPPGFTVLVVALYRPPSFPPSSLHVTTAKLSPRQPPWNIFCRYLWGETCWTMGPVLLLQILRRMQLTAYALWVCTTVYIYIYVIYIYMYIYISVEDL